MSRIEEIDNMNLDGWSAHDVWQHLRDEVVAHEKAKEKIEEARKSLRELVGDDGDYSGKDAWYFIEHFLLDLFDARE